jgi:hypothetical protein
MSRENVEMVRRSLDGWNRSEVKAFCARGEASGRVRSYLDPAEGLEAVGLG